MLIFSVVRKTETLTNKPEIISIVYVAADMIALIENISFLRQHVASIHPRIAINKNTQIKQIITIVLKKSTFESVLNVWGVLVGESVGTLLGKLLGSILGIRYG